MVSLSHGSKALHPTISKRGELYHRRTYRPKLRLLERTVPVFFEWTSSLWLRYWLHSAAWYDHYGPNIDGSVTPVPNPDHQFCFRQTKLSNPGSLVLCPTGFTASSLTALPLVRYGSLLRSISTDHQTHVCLNCNISVVWQVQHLPT